LPVLRASASFARMINLLVSFFAVIALQSAQAELPPGVDPLAEDTVIRYGGPDPVIVDTAAGPVAFTVDIADTQITRARGMMWRDDLAPDAGMLFLHPQTQYLGYYMRNTLIPLDLLFIREDGEIAKIIVNAQPLSLRNLPSDTPVNAVLELAGGRSLEAGIEPGDIVRHPFFDNVETPAAVPEPEAAPN